MINSSIFQLFKSRPLSPFFDWRKVIKNLSSSGIVNRVNFAGGEPFLNPHLLLDMAKCCKAENLETSVITNGSLVTKTILDDIIPYIDMVGISVDSGDSRINQMIGRHSRNRLNEISHEKKALEVCQWVKERGKTLKCNTVICRENLHDDSIFQFVEKAGPKRWKVFRVLPIENENGIDKDRRPPYSGYITDLEWKEWQKRCAKKCRIPPVLEDNDVMQNSYIPVDELGYLLDCSSGKKIRSSSLLHVPFKKALSESGFDLEKFDERGGFFKLDK